MWKLYQAPQPRLTTLPITDSTCSFCHKIGYWRVKCRKAKKSNPTVQKNNPPYHPKNWQGGGKKADEVGVLEGDPHCDEITIHAWLADQKKRPKDPKEIVLADISIDVMTESFANVEMPVASKKRASLWCRIDTSVEGKVMSLWAFWKLFPNWLTKTRLLIGLQKCKTKLRVYNETNIPQLSPLNITISWKDKETSKVHKTDNTFYVVDTPGPAILGLPSCSRLRIVHLNYSVKFRKHGKPINTCPKRGKIQQDMKNLKPINSCEDRRKIYPDHFEGIGKFPGTYHNHLKEDAIPIACTKEVPDSHKTTGG